MPDAEPAVVEKMSTPNQNAIQEAFDRFKAERSWQFTARLRRTRARQLRELLSDPDAIDLETFDHEVWQVENTTRLRGQDISRTLIALTPIRDTQQIADLEAALDNGALDLHGNYMWRAGTRRYGTPLHGTSEEQKLENVRSALRTLNRDDLTPVEKATQICEIPGFGESTATGLVMVFHPDEFIVCVTVHD